MGQPRDEALEADVLAQASLNAARALGLTQTDLAGIVGRDRSRLRAGIDPASKSGELALLFVRAYRSLFALVGGDPEAMSRWVRGENRGTGGVPAEQMRSVEGLARVVGYLDAMRGRV